MALNILRGLFVLLMAAVGYSFVVRDPSELGALEGQNWLGLALAVVLGVATIALDVLAGERKLVLFGGVVLGGLLGLALGYVLSYVIALLVDNVFLPDSLASRENATATNFLSLLVGVICCYFGVSFVLQTKDDFRFIIPYVEFRRDARGGRPTVVDTSALVDVRLGGVVDSGFLEGRLIVPRFVVDELQELADRGDGTKRGRGRRGLDALERLRRLPGRDVRIYDAPADPSGQAGPGDPVDRRLVELARSLDARLLTVDFNLVKVSRLSGVATLSLNELAAAVRADALPGERMPVRIDRRGTGEGQGVGHLGDGTMVVVEDAADRVGETVEATITNTTQTAAGRMIFGRVGDEDGAAAVADDDEPPRPRRKRPARKAPAEA